MIAHQHTPTSPGAPRRRGRSPVVAIAGLIGVGALLAACSGNVNGPNPGSSSTATGSGSSAPTPSATTAVDTLKIANAVKVDTLDPAQNAVNESIWIDQNLYARLVQADPTGSKIVPDLASSWDISPDKLTYTFHLRDATFSDGSPVTAADAKWSIERARALDGGWGFLLTPVKSITAVDATTLKITLSAVHSPLPADLAMYAYAVLPQAKVTADKDFFTHPVTSGPFTIASYNPDTEIDLAANPKYWGPKPKISTVAITVVPNDNTRVLQLQSKQVDVIENPPGNLLKQIAQNPSLRVDLFPSTRVDFIQLPLKTKPFNDVRVRQAVKYAVDLGQVTSLAYQGNARPANTFFPYQMLYWSKTPAAPTQDLAKAKALLIAAGFPQGFSTNLITVSGDAAGQAEAVVLKSQLAKVGINVSIQPYELVTAYDKERPGTNGMGERYWTNDIIDPDEVATFGADGKGGGANAFSTYWSDATATRLVNAARSEPDPTKRAAMYAQIQQIVADQVPYLPTTYTPYRYASGTWVHGFSVSPLGNYNDSLLTLSIDSH